MSMIRERTELPGQQTIDNMFMKVAGLKDEESRSLGTKVEWIIDTKEQ